VHNTTYEIPDQIDAFDHHGVVRASLVRRVLKVSVIASVLVIMMYAIVATITVERGVTYQSQYRGCRDALDVVNASASGFLVGRLDTQLDNKLEDVGTRCFGQTYLPELRDGRKPFEDTKAELAIKPGTNPYRMVEMTIAAVPQLQELVSAMRWQLDTTAPPSLLNTVESLV